MSSEWLNFATFELVAAHTVGDSFRFQTEIQFVHWSSLLRDDRFNRSAVIAFQPFAFYQLGEGWYLRAAPIWAFNLESGDYSMPMGERCFWRWQVRLLR